MRINFSIPSYSISSFNFGNKATEKKKEKLIKLLSDAKDNNKRLTISQLSQKTGLTYDTVCYYLRSDKNIKSLWFWVKSKEHTTYTQAEMQEQSNIIEEQLQLATQQKRTITGKELAAIALVEEHTVKDRIASDDDLADLKEDNLALNDKNYNLEIKKIKELLQEAQASGLKITQAYISQATGIPTSTVSKRIQEKRSLNNLFEQVRACEHTTYTKKDMAAQNNALGVILSSAIEQGQKMTVSRVAEKFEAMRTADEKSSAKIKAMKPNTILSRMQGNKFLNPLWAQVKIEENVPPTKSEKDDQSKKIEEILTEAKDKGERITLSRLASLAGVTKSVAERRIKKSQILNLLWQAVCSKPNGQYSKEDIEVQNVMIGRILRQRISDNIKPTYYQMSQYLDLSEKAVKERVESNPEFDALFKAGQNPST